MSAKQTLIEYVAGLTEEEAQQKLPLLADAGDPPPLTAAQMEEIHLALASLARGEKVPHEEVKRRFGLR